MAIALFATSCVSSRQTSSKVVSQRSDIRSDTLREQVVVTIHDTIREVTTITVRENEQGDTVRLVQVTDLTHARARDRVLDKEVKLIVKTDTVYVERESDKQAVVAAGPNTEIAPDGTVTKRVNRVAQTLKWVFLAALAIAVLLLVLKFYRR